jgi:hypothetical protein
MTMAMETRGMQSRRSSAPARRARNGTVAPLLWLKRRFRQRPGSTLAWSAFTMVGLIVVSNAAFLQPKVERVAAPEPPPAARSVVTAPPLPPVRPSERQQAAIAAPAQTAPPASTPTNRPQAAAASSVPAAPRPETVRDPIGELLRTGQPPLVEPVRPPGNIPAERAQQTASLPDNRQAIAAQRALNRLGYGPLREDGRIGEGTRAALERFERDRRIAVTRDLSPRTLRELATASGTRIE